MYYKSVGTSLEDEAGEQVGVFVPANCTKKRAREICKILANVLNNIERGKQK